MYYQNKICMSVTLIRADFGFNFSDVSFQLDTNGTDE